jgi:hypothetical protein
VIESKPLKAQEIFSCGLIAENAYSGVMWSPGLCGAEAIRETPKL